MKRIFSIALIAVALVCSIAAKPYLSDNIETTSQLATYTPAEGQIVVDKTKDTLIVGDGSTMGGIPLARQDLSTSALTASRAAVTNASGGLAAATTTAAEIGYVNGVTSAIQTQIDGKEPTINNNAFYVDNTNLNVAVQDTTPNYNFSVSQATTGIGTITNAALANEVQSITPDLVPDTGTYTISFDSKTTAAIAFDGNTSAIQSALNTATLSDITAAGSMLTAITLTYTGAYAGADQILATVIDTMTSTDTPVVCTVAQVTAGNPGTAVVGTGTQFTNTFKVGDSITAGGQTKAISAIASDTAMTTAAFTIANSGAAYTLSGGERFKVYGNGNIFAPVIKPNSDSTTAFKIMKADGVTAAVNIDTTNKRLGIGVIPLTALHLSGASGASTALRLSGTNRNYDVSLVNGNDLNIVDASGGQNFVTMSAGGSQILTQFETHRWTNKTDAGGDEYMRINPGGKVGIGVTAPTAILQLKIGTAAAGTAPQKFSSGTLSTTAEAGAVEYNNQFYLTDSTASRRAVASSADTSMTADTTKVVDGYINLNIAGTNYKVMITN